MKIIAPGKVILFGEYAVLEGRHALVAGVRRYAEAVWQSANQLTVSAPGIGVFSPAQGLRDLPYIMKAAEAFPGLTGEFQLDTRAFRGEHGKLGLGSSAASIVTFIASALQRQGRPLHHPTIFDLAQRAHQAVQGLGSGADVASSTYGGVIRYRWGGRVPDNDDAHESISADITPVPGGLDSVLMVFTGRSANTRELVSQVHIARRESRARYDTAIDGLSRAEEIGYQAWVSGDRFGLIEAAHKSRESLESLSRLADADLVSGSHRRLSEVVGGDGMVKPTGAGGGDLAWVIPSSHEAEQSLTVKLERSGYECLRLEVDSGGVRQATSV